MADMQARGADSTEVVDGVSKTRNWVNSFAALQALQPHVVVPGHGQVANLTYLEIEQE